jgi:hypothetical protein
VYAWPVGQPVSGGWYGHLPWVMTTPFGQTVGVGVWADAAEFIANPEKIIAAANNAPPKKESFMRIPVCHPVAGRTVLGATPSASEISD